MKHAQPAPERPQPKFGRVPATDLRDHAYRLPRRRPAPGVRSRTWFSGPALDQGNTSQCVGYSGAHWLAAGPVRNLRDVPSPEACYRAAQQHDEWPGQEPDYYGTSVRALFKVLQAQGYIGEYRWAYTAADCAAWVLSAGPMVVGTVWSSGMMDPDAKGFLRPTGSIEGGHAYTLIAANLDKKCPDGTKGALRVLNSWGTDWGEKGRAWISLAEFDVLMREDGEAVTAVEVLKPPKA